MANLRKLWAMKTSLRGIANTEGKPDMLTSPYWMLRSLNHVGADDVIYYTGGKYTITDPSSYLFALNYDNFYGRWPNSGPDYGSVARIDWTRFFRDTNSAFDLEEGIAGFDVQVTSKQPYFSGTYDSINTSFEFPNFWSRYFTGSYITPRFYDTTKINSQDEVFPEQFPAQWGTYAAGTLWDYPSGYDIWHRMFSPDLLGSYPYEFKKINEWSTFSRTRQDSTSLESRYYIKTWGTDTPGVWNEFEGATLNTDYMSGAYLDKFWYSGTITDSNKEQLAKAGKAFLRSDVYANNKDDSFVAQNNMGMCIAFEIELALQRWGMQGNAKPNVSAENYIAGNFTFDGKAAGYYSNGANLLIPCWVHLKDGGRSSNSQESIVPLAGPQHLKRYVIVSISLEQPFNPESYIPGSGIILDTERVPGSYIFDLNRNSGYWKGDRGAEGSNVGRYGNAVFARGNFTDVILNTNTTTEPDKYPEVSCLRFSENGEDWYWTGGDVAGVGTNERSNQYIYQANAGIYGGTTNDPWKATSQVNHFYLSHSSNPAYYPNRLSNWNIASNIRGFRPGLDSPTVKWFSSEPWAALDGNIEGNVRNSYNYSTSRIQAFRWSNDGRFLYILWVKNADTPNTGTNYTYQWVERHWCSMPEGFKVKQDNQANCMYWAGGTPVYNIFADETKDSDYIYPAKSIDVTPDGLYLQVLFDYFDEGFPTISEHLVGGNDQSFQSRAEYMNQNPTNSSLDFRLGLSTAPEMSLFHSLRDGRPDLEDAIYNSGTTGYREQIRDFGITWPTVTVYPGKIAPNSNTSTIDAGATDVYLTFGYTNYQSYGFEYGLSNSGANNLSTDNGTEIKTYPSDFSWSTDGSVLYLFGFFEHEKYSPQAPGCIAPNTFWNLRDGAPIAWHVRMYGQRPRFDGYGPNDATYPQRFPGIYATGPTYDSGARYNGAFPYLYNNRIYWMKEFHDARVSYSVDNADRACYTPTNEDTDNYKIITIDISKAAFDASNGYPSGTGNTEYFLEGSSSRGGVFATQGYNVFSKDTICFAKSSKANVQPNTNGGYRIEYRIRYGDSSMSGDGFRIEDTSGNEYTSPFIQYYGTPGDGSGFVRIYLDPSESWPSVLRVRSTTDSNIGFNIFIRDVPKFHWCTYTLAESGASNDGSIWYEYPLREQSQFSSSPALWGASTHTNSAVFNLAKNGRFINSLCAYTEGNNDGSNYGVQRVATWDIDYNAAENRDYDPYLGEDKPDLEDNQYIGIEDPSNVPNPGVLPPKGGKVGGWGNGIHFSMGNGDLRYVPVTDEESVLPVQSRARLINKESYYDRPYSLSGPSLMHFGMEQLGDTRLPRPVEFDFQDGFQNLSTDGSFTYVHWPYCLTTSEEPQTVACFWDRRGSFKGLWFTSTMPREYTLYETPRQTGIFLWGYPYYTDNWRYGYHTRIPYSVNYYKEWSEVGLPGSEPGPGYYLDTSEVPIGTGSATTYIDYEENLKDFKILNATFMTSNWQSGRSFNRVDVPKFIWRERGVDLGTSRNSTPSQGNNYTLAYMDADQLSGGDIQYGVARREFNGPNFNTVGYAYLNGGRVELEIPDTFDTYWYTTPTEIDEAVYDTTAQAADQIQLRSLRFVDGGKRLVALVSGELRTIGGVTWAKPAWSVLMYDLEQPYNIENATLDKTFSYSNAQNSFSDPQQGHGSWWQAYSRNAATYYGGDMYFHPDGSKFWVIGIESSKSSIYGQTTPYMCRTLLYEFDMGTNWDLSTVTENGFATYDNIAHNGNGFDLPCNLEVSPDGNVVYWGSFGPQSGLNDVRTFSSTLPNPYDLKNFEQTTETPYTYQGFQGTKIQAGLRMYAEDGAGQRIRFPSTNPNRWYRTNYADDVVTNAGAPTADPEKDASVATYAQVALSQPLGGCSPFEKGGRKYQKAGSSVTIGNMGMFPTRPHNTQYNYTSYGRGKRSFVSFFDIFIWAMDPEETTMLVSDGQRWLYQLVFNNDRGVHG